MRGDFGPQRGAAILAEHNSFFAPDVGALVRAAPPHVALRSQNLVLVPHTALHQQSRTAQARHFEVWWKLVELNGWAGSLVRGSR